jgi:hypothetical protein
MALVKLLFHWQPNEAVYLYFDFCILKLFANAKDGFSYSLYNGPDGFTMNPPKISLM